MVRAEYMRARCIALQERIERAGFLPWSAEEVVEYLMTEEKEEKDESVRRDAPTLP